MSFNPKQPRKPYAQVPKLSGHGEAEFGPGKSGLLMCERCKAVYFKKYWHRNLEALNNKEAESLSVHDTSVKFTLCPACTMMKDGRYEGRVTVVGIPAAHRDELKKLIENFGARAYERDAMHRVIDVKDSGADVIATTTENQLAVKLGKKINETFRGAKVAAKYAGDTSDVAEVTVEFLHE